MQSELSVSDIFTSRYQPDSPTYPFRPRELLSFAESRAAESIKCRGSGDFQLCRGVSHSIVERKLSDRKSLVYGLFTAPADYDEEGLQRRVCSVYLSAALVIDNRVSEYKYITDTIADSDEAVKLFNLIADGLVFPDNLCEVIEDYVSAMY